MPNKATEGYLTATVKAPADGDAGGTFEAILSMPTVDRDGEIVDAKAFDPLPERIVIDRDHGMSVATTVGDGEPFYDEDGILKLRGRFAPTPLGQETRALVVAGFIDTMSVAYRAAKYEDGEDGIPHLRKAELLNAAIVAIPSNREALITTAKEAKVGARNSAGDAGRIQNAHDMLVDLGAKCAAEPEKHVTSATTSNAGVVLDVTGAKTTVSSLSEQLNSLNGVTYTVTVPTKSATTPDAAAAPAAARPAEVALAEALAEASLAL